MVAMVKYFDKLEWVEGAASYFELPIDFVAYTDTKPMTRGLREQLDDLNQLECRQWIKALGANIKAFGSRVNGDAVPMKGQTSHLTEFGLPKQADGAFDEAHLAKAKGIG